MLTREEQIQGSPEWLEARRERVTGTDVAKILGLSPYGTKYDLFIEKMGLKETKTTPQMAAGSDAEGMIREWYEAKTGELWMPAVLTHKEYDWCMASLDGINADHSETFEAKLTKAEYFEMAKAGRLPDHFRCQLQWGLFVSGAKTAHCVLYNAAADDYCVVIEQRDDAFIKTLYEAAKAFYDDHMITGVAPATSSADYVVVDEPEALDAMETWLKAKRSLDAATEAEKTARARLLDHTDDGNTIIGDVKLTKYPINGVDYKKAAVDSGIDLAQYKKPTKYGWRLTVMGLEQN